MLSCVDLLLSHLIWFPFSHFMFHICLYFLTPSTLCFLVLFVINCSLTPAWNNLVAAITLEEWFVLKPVIPAIWHIWDTVLLAYCGLQLPMNTNILLLVVWVVFNKMPNFFQWQILGNELSVLLPTAKCIISSAQEHLSIDKYTGLRFSKQSFLPVFSFHCRLLAQLVMLDELYP